MALSTNLVSYYKLDGNSNDSVGSNNGTDTAITYSLANGKIAQGAGFNGSSSKIVLPNLGVSGTSARTISMWLNFSSLAAERDFIFFGTDTGAGTVLILYASSAGALANYSNACDFITANGVVTTNVWYNFVFVYDGGATTSTSTVHFYLNGVAQSLAKSGTGNFNQSNNNYNLGWTSMNGSIDEVGIWNRALSSTEISQLYRNGSGNQYPFNQGNFFAFM